MIPDNCRSDTVSFLRAVSRSISASRCSITSIFRVCTAKYVWAKAMGSLLGSPF